MTLCVNLTIVCIVLTTGAVKSVSFRQKVLFEKPHLLVLSMVDAYCSITALKGPEVVRKLNKNFQTKNSPFGGCFKKIKTFENP